ncbi:MAG: site-specific DNA-methyltransferase [Candidatus Lokiarchaeota archaeon]|nr:site-specific DNA-methyltransferase [Candidatus Lokiarchaeota archaeon]
MSTHHKVYYKKAQQMEEVEDNSVALVITSPPYPMIEMWDEIFSLQNEEIKAALEVGDGLLAFEKMHEELDKIWKELYRVVIPGGIICVNIGDATRTINKNFQIFPSHSRIITAYQKLGFQNLPEILWRKQTNAPNKFMGSGMLPPGAYITLEHEYILIFRKDEKREFKTEALKENRRESGYFWKERNIWFSDVWDFKGISQDLSNKEMRKRSAAYPFELAFRLINMFSVRNDIILDPFLGTGTSSLAAMVSERNSIGYEIDVNFKEIIKERFLEVISFGNKYIQNRINSHLSFITERIKEKGPTKYTNANLNVSVITSQEKDLKINKLSSIKEINKEFVLKYKKINGN